jgi:hypothetical protein
MKIQKKERKKKKEKREKNEANIQQPKKKIRKNPQKST